MKAEKIFAKKKRVFCAFKGECDFKKQFLRKNRLSLKLIAQSALGNVLVINRSIT